MNIGSKELPGSFNPLDWTYVQCNMYFDFSATVLGFFSGIPQPCIRAEMSRLVNKEEQGMPLSINQSTKQSE